MELVDLDSLICLDCLVADFYGNVESRCLPYKRLWQFEKRVAFSISSIGV